MQGHGGRSVIGKFVLVLITFAVLFIPVFGLRDADDWFENGKALYDLGNYDEAIKAFDEAIEAESAICGCLDS